MVFLFSLAIPQLVLSLFSSTFVIELLVQTMIYGILALSLNLLLGYTGLPSLGQAGYLGVAAYAVAICTSKFHMGALPASIIAILLATSTAAFFGLFALRAREVYFLMITFALAMVIWGLANRWISITAGDQGLSGIKRPQIGPFSMREITSYYYFVLFIFLLCFFLIYKIIHSPFGHSLIGIKESESRMRMLGYNVWLHKYICFVISGFFGGISGVLFIFYNGFIAPTIISLYPSVEVVLMVALGGPGTVLGPLIGSVVIIFVKNFVSIYTQRWLIILGSIYVFIVLYAPKGILKSVRTKRKLTIIKFGGQ